MARKHSPPNFGGELPSFPQYRLEKPEFFGSTRLSKDIPRRAFCDKWFSVQKAGLDMLTPTSGMLQSLACALKMRHLRL
jgi:hypothetical protein